MWYETSLWRTRLPLEQAAMEDRFPQFVLRRSGDGSLYWEGIVSPRRDAEFRVAIWYPAHYPYGEPVLRVLEPAIRPGAPHVYRDGNLCAHRERWDPSRGTAAGQVPLLCDWLDRYLDWLEDGRPF